METKTVDKAVYNLSKIDPLKLQVVYKHHLKSWLSFWFRYFRSNQYIFDREEPKPFHYRFTKKIVWEDKRIKFRTFLVLSFNGKESFEAFLGWFVRTTSTTSLEELGEIDENEIPLLEE